MNHAPNVLIETFEATITASSVASNDNDIQAAVKEKELADRREAFRKANLGCKDLPAYNLRGLSLMPPLEFIIDGYVPSRGLVLIYGPSGHGKSFMVIEHMLCLATGHDWHGHKITKKGLVIYVIGEGEDGVTQRTAAWCHRKGVSIDDVPFVTFIRAVDMLDPKQVQRLIANIQKIAKQYDLPVVGVYFDTVAQNFGDGDENTQRDMNRFVKAANNVRRAFRCFSGLIHHTPKGRLDSRGSNALPSAVDTSIQVSFKDEAKQIMEVKIIKQKEGSKVPVRLFKLTEISVPHPNNGKIVKTCELAPVENYEAHDEEDDAPRLGKNQAPFFAIIQHAGVDGIDELTLRAELIATGVDLSRSSTFKATLRDLEKKALVAMMNDRWVALELLPR